MAVVAADDRSLAPAASGQCNAAAAGDDEPRPRRFSRVGAKQRSVFAQAPARRVSCSVVITAVTLLVASTKHSGSQMTGKQSVHSLQTTSISGGGGRADGRPAGAPMAPMEGGRRGVRSLRSSYDRTLKPTFTLSPIHSLSPPTCRLKQNPTGRKEHALFASLERTVLTAAAADGVGTECWWVDGEEEGDCSSGPLCSA